MTQPYHIESYSYVSGGRTSLLKGPEGLLCFLDNPDDRDEVVTRLNEQHAEIQRLRAKYEANPEDRGQGNTRSVKEDCSRGYQRCHECDDFRCVDNIAYPKAKP